MKLCIGEKLKYYRRRKGLTQEEVAAHVGISFQAISKWERGEGYPDITMLPTLANYFGITVDELIGMEEIASQKAYDEMNRTWKENHYQGKHPANVKLMREGLKRYPDEALLLVQLSTSLEKLDGTEAEKEANLRESVLLQEEILRGKDSEVRSATLYNICFAYEKLGEHEKAMTAARKLPNLYKTRENAFVSLAKGEEKHHAALCALTPIAYAISHHLTALAETEGDPEYLDKIEKIHEILFDKISQEEAKAIWMDAQK